MRRNAQLLPRPHPGGHLHPTSIETHFALSNHGVNPALRDIFQKPQQQIVYPLPLLPGLNLVEPGAVTLAASGMIAFPFRLSHLKNPVNLPSRSAAALAPQGSQSRLVFA